MNRHIPTPRLFLDNIHESAVIKANRNFIEGKVVKLNYKVKAALNINDKKVKCVNNVIYIPVDFDNMFFDNNDMKFIKYEGYIFKVWYLCKDKEYDIYVTLNYSDIFGVLLKDKKFKKKVIEKVFNKDTLAKMYDRSQKYYKISSSRYKDN